MSYTRGPWIADDNEGFGALTIWSRMTPSGNGPAGPMIAKVIGDSAEADDNAKLIAAAPDLFEALLLCRKEGLTSYVFVIADAALKKAIQ